MKIQNMSIFMGDTTRQERLSGQQTQAQRRGGSIFAGNINQNQDNILNRKQQLQKKAMKVVTDYNAGEAKVDADLEERRNKIRDLQNSSKQSMEEMQKLDELTKQAKEYYGVEDGSQEQKELEKLLSYRKRDSWTEKEWEKLGDMNDLTPYQRIALENDSLKGQYREQLSQNKQQIQAETSVIRSVGQERLKTLGMIKAENTKDEMMEAASKEIIGMLQQEAKDHIDEEQEKIQEEASKRAEKQEEQEKKLEESKLEREEAELELEKNKSDTQKQQEVMEPVQEQNAQVLKDVQKADNDNAKIEAELKKIIEEQKLLEEELKGLVVDTVS